MGPSYIPLPVAYYPSPSVRALFAEPVRLFSCLFVMLIRGSVSVSVQKRSTKSHEIIRKLASFRGLWSLRLKKLAYLNSENQVRTREAGGSVKPGVKRSGTRPSADDVHEARSAVMQ